MTQWEEKARVDLWPEIKVTHQGKPREHWFGRDPKNAKRMRALFTLGLWEAWQLRAGHIATPEPMRFCIEPGPLHTWIHPMLDQYSSKDPFLYQVRIGSDPRPEEEFIPCPF